MVEKPNSDSRVGRLNLRHENVGAVLANKGEASVSELAVNELGNEMSAFEFRDEYLSTGIEYKNFRCALCDVPVSPCAIYGVAFKKAPHFREAHIPHRAGCLYGNALVAGMKKIQPKKGRRIFGKEVNLPEKLIARRATSSMHLPPAHLGSRFPTPAETEGRIKSKKSQLELTNHYTTSLLRTVVEARKAIINECYMEAKLKCLNDKKRAALIQETLESCPLSLYDKVLNYETAFRSTRVRPWQQPLIYFGKAIVEQRPSGFVLQSQNKVKDPNTEGETPALIHVQLDSDVTNSKLAAEILSTLTDISNTQQPIEWFAYGNLALREDGSAYELKVGNADHLYLRHGTR